jgi:hypothetical protein
MEKKEWSEPELIVLVRRKPEEAVLTGCKVTSMGGGNNDVFGGCLYTITEGGPADCGYCNVGQTS